MCVLVERMLTILASVYESRADRHMMTSVSLSLGGG